MKNKMTECSCILFFVCYTTKKSRSFRRKEKVNRSKGKGNAVWICGSPCCCKGDEWSIAIGESWEGRPGGWPRARRPPLWFWDVSVSMEDWCMFQRDGWRSIWRLFWFCVSGKFFQALFCAYRVEKSLHACACTEVCKTLRPARHEHKSGAKLRDMRMAGRGLRELLCSGAIR